MSSVVEAVNEYVPVSPICLLAPSNLLRNLYLMTKVNENAEWTDANNFDYQLTYEFVTYRTMGNYGSVSNAPVYMNFTPSANYAVNSSNYTGTDPDGKINLILGQISESLEDDDDEYGSRP